MNRFLPRPPDTAEFVVINGITADGQVFRPSDWAQRLALAASAGTCAPERPVCFHPNVRIATRDGVPSVMVAKSLEQAEPALYAFLVGFAREHDLQVFEATQLVHEDS